MKIRHAVIEDIPNLLEFGDEYWENTPYASTGMPYREDAYEGVIRHLIENEYFRVVEVDGVIAAFIGAAVAPVALNPDYMVAQEIFWYVAPEHRTNGFGHMLREVYEEEMKTAGVSIVTMQDMSSSADMENYLLAADYTMTERVFAKVI